MTGWGGTSPSAARVVELPTSLVASVLDDVDHRGVLARGLGRSYGDSAQNGGGLVVRLVDSIDAAVIDETAGTMTVGAGVSLDAIMRHIVPKGWFVPVTPGTRFVTVGGAIASDIHGKGHHRDGSFGNHVRRLSLLLSDGSVVELGPDEQPEWFWATVGGMGLTGVILDATFALQPIETSRCIVDTDRADDLDTVMALMSESDHDYHYSVAWLDLMAQGKHLGRSILGRGDHAPIAALDASDRDDPLAYGPRTLATVPPLVPGPGVVNRFTIGAFNELWFRKAPRRRRGEIHSLTGFFHPLDGVLNWNRLYGRRGFIQYQFVVPFGEEAALQRIVERCAAIRSASFVTVLKRFGDSNPAPLSFPTPGWTLTVDLATSQPGLAELVADLDAAVMAADGRHYLTKDAITTREAFRRGYPRLDEWRAIRDKMDPAGTWQSDQARRLGLVSE